MKIWERLLKNEGGDRFLVKKSFYAFLVCAFHKEPNERSKFKAMGGQTLFYEVDFVL